MSDTAKAVLRGNFIAIRAQLKNQRTQINNPMILLRV
jgi:hypothetical protein